MSRDQYQAPAKLECFVFSVRTHCADGAKIQIIGPYCWFCTLRGDIKLSQNKKGQKFISSTKNMSFSQLSAAKQDTIFCVARKVLVLLI